MYRWIVFLHVLSAFGFFMVHGASMLMAFRLRREQGLDRIRAILDLSNAALPMAYIFMLLLVVFGIIAGLMGSWFSRGWIWTAIVLIVLLWFGMHAYAAEFYSPVRKAVGLPYRDRQGEHPAEPPASEAEINVVIQATNPPLLMGVSFGLVAVILWLMMFKPF